MVHVQALRLWPLRQQHRVLIGAHSTVVLTPAIAADLDTVEAARPKLSAMTVAEWPAAIPRDISSLSAIDRCRSLRFDAGNRIPPDCSRKFLTR